MEIEFNTKGLARQVTAQKQSKLFIDFKESLSKNIGNSDYNVLVAHSTENEDEISVSGLSDSTFAVNVALGILDKEINMADDTDRYSIINAIKRIIEV